MAESGHYIGTTHRHDQMGQSQGGPLLKLQTGATMQPLRFRVWDRDYNILIPPSDVMLSFVYLEDKAEPRASLFDWKKQDWKPIPLSDIMRSTLQRDRNGREIFEGDILRLPGGGRLLVQGDDSYSQMSRYAVPQPALLSHPRSRVLVVGGSGYISAADLHKSLRGRNPSLGS